MKRFRLAILLIIFSVCLSVSDAQKKPAAGCSFLKHIKFKNGVDTIHIKAKWTSLFENPDNFNLKKLAAKRILRYREFVTRSGGMESASAISFVPEGCSQSYSAAISEKTYPVHFLKAGEMVELTCVVFNQYFNAQTKSQPYFVIIAIKKR